MTANKPGRSGPVTLDVVRRAIICLCLMLSVLGCEDQTPSRIADTDDATTRQASADQEASSDAGDGDATAADITLPPKPTFAQHCARCHGPEGMFYAVPFQHEGAALRAVVEEMMRDHAGLNPTEADIDAMVDYHRQIRDRRTGDANE